MKVRKKEGEVFI